MTGFPKDNEDRDALAGEYVLGLLTIEEQERFERDLIGEVDMAERVDFWRERLAGLSGLAATVVPDPAVWERIEAAIAPRRRVSILRPNPWRSLNVWRAIAATALFASILLGTLLLSEPAVDRGPDLLAVLQPRSGGSPGYLVQVQGRELVATPLQTVDPAGRALQFWTLADPAQGPVSLGLVTPGTRHSVPLTRLPGLREGQLFEITLEPPGGSPTGRPTGEILFLGRMVTIPSG